MKRGVVFEKWNRDWWALRTGNFVVGWNQGWWHCAPEIWLVGGIAIGGHCPPYLPIRKALVTVFLPRQIFWRWLASLECADSLVAPPRALAAAFDWVDTPRGQN